MPSKFPPVFARLRRILAANAAGFTVACDTAGHYSLEASPGPATLQAWGGKLKRRTFPVAAVRLGKSYVSYHLMGVYCCPEMLKGTSDKLKQRMQGKSCFNFKEVDEPLFEELERLTAESIARLKSMGFVS